MCCIVYKPAGVEMPDNNLLNRIYRCNHDGFGFVSTRHHYKGLDYTNFLSHLAEVERDENCIIHYRFATNGSVCDQNCHPFAQNGVYFAHNGILAVKPCNDMTDSEYAFKTRIYPVIKKHGFASRQMDHSVCDIIGSSRFAFMYRNKVKLYGEFIKHNGIYYSNLRWLF